MEREELRIKPCPKCGGMSMVFAEGTLASPETCYEVMCVRCPERGGINDNAGEAVKSWNASGSEDKE